MHTEPYPTGLKPTEEKDRWLLTSTFEVEALTMDEALSLPRELVKRRTHRNSSPLAVSDVLSLIRFVMQARELGVGKNVGRRRKISISAGAMHPIEALVVSGPGVPNPVIYSDVNDVFGTVQFRSRKQANHQIQELLQVVPEAKGHLLLLVANVRHLGSAYSDPVSLLWRDAGALLQNFSLVSSALGLAFVPLGPTGARLLDTIDKPHSDYVAVGTGIIGRIRTEVGAES